MPELEDIKYMIKKSPATTFLVTVLFVTFISSYIYGEGPTDLQTARLFGAITPQDATTEDLFRLISYTFLQIGGPIHLLMNLGMIIVAGPFLERVYGSFKYTFLFLVTGMVGGLFVLMFSDPNVIVGGASGSGYGLIGLYIGLVLRKHPFIDETIKNWVWNLLWINILYTFFIPGISIAGHLGGLTAGILLSMVLHAQIDDRYYKSNWIFSITKSALGFITAVVIVYIPKFLWPSTELPYIQAVRMKFVGAPVLDSNTGLTFDVSHGDKFFLNEFADNTSVLYYYINIFFSTFKTSLLELIFCAILVVIIYKLIINICIHSRINKFIKIDRQLYSLAKETRQEHVLYRISENTLNRYLSKYPKFNRQKLKKKVEFEVKLIFGNPLEKAFVFFIKATKLIVTLFMVGILSIFISFINDNKKFHAAEFGEELYSTATQEYLNGNYKNAVRLLKLVSKESIFYQDAYNLIPIFSEALKNQYSYEVEIENQYGESTQSWYEENNQNQYNVGEKSQTYDGIDEHFFWLEDIKNSRLYEKSEFYIGDILSEDRFENQVWEKRDNIISVNGYFVEGILPKEPLYVYMAFLPAAEDGQYSLTFALHGEDILSVGTRYELFIEAITSSLIPN